MIPFHPPGNCGTWQPDLGMELTRPSGLVPKLSSAKLPLPAKGDMRTIICRHFCKSVVMERDPEFDEHSAKESGAPLCTQTT